MILRVLATSLLLVSGAYASTSHHTAGHHATGSHTADAKPDRQKKGGAIMLCTEECEKITEDHFMSAYGDMCSPDTPEGKKILNLMKQYDIALKGRGIKSKHPKEAGVGCEPEKLRKISRFDMLNNKPFEKGEKSPFEYGTLCVAQCRDPEGKTSGRDMEAEMVYVKPGVVAVKSTKVASGDASKEKSPETPPVEVDASESPAPEVEVN